MTKKAVFFQLFGLAGMANPLIADAHAWHFTSEVNGFFAGMLHPLTGSDHIIAMLVVGFWIARASRRSLMMLPLLVVAMMIIGGALTLIPIEIAHAENIMILSAGLLGLMLLFNAKVSPLIAALVAGNLALIHGYVHAFDIWLDSDAIEYALGFALSTLMVIAVAIGMSKVLENYAPELDGPVNSR
ncbi:HupE/UreJ family protein [Methylomonas sp. SURF-2]|uniref:HupE/UreJ family protein n=1 Tax=Methylomonas subterranea TaxID=2952225 RepID=A0ABT1TEI0_9GAMM|nr:HupE/UreJ family protein [Methylomonas sp. SURF-2]MCQ8103870.1 HupE/UreJ family protein [Methylomonas sp. SURF-2]